MTIDDLRAELRTAEADLLSLRDSDLDDALTSQLIRMAESRVATIAEMISANVFCMCAACRSS